MWFYVVLWGFMGLYVIECGVRVLINIPRATRVVFVYVGGIVFTILVLEWGLSLT